VGSAAYAWSLQGIVNDEMNLLLLRPLFVVIWLLLAAVVFREVVPAIRRQLAWNQRSTKQASSWRERFAPGTELGAGLMVAATFGFSMIGPGDGPVIYLVS